MMTNMFRKALLDHADFVWENIYLPSLRFLCRKFLFKNVFDRTFLSDFQNFCGTFCNKLNAQLCQENISCTF